jgi:cerevisin
MKGIIALTLVATASATFPFRVGTVHNDAAPILSSTAAEHIPDSYIIKFKTHVNERNAAAHHSWIQKIHGEREQERLELRKRGLTDLVDDVFQGIKHTYKIGESFMGYSGHFDESVIEQVRRHPDVSFCPPVTNVAPRLRRFAPSLWSQSSTVMWRRHRLT